MRPSHVILHQISKPPVKGKLYTDKNPKEKEASQSERGVFASTLLALLWKTVLSRC